MKNLNPQIKLKLNKKINIKTTNLIQKKNHLLNGLSVFISLFPFIGEESLSLNVNISSVSFINGILSV